MNAVELAQYASELLGVELDPATARPDESGWDFHVTHIMDTGGSPWILRRPRHPQAARQLATEGAVLAAVRDRLPVAVPNWRLQTPRLVAYPRLPGAQAGAEDPRTLVYGWDIDPLAAPDAYLEPLARALAEVHRTPHDALPALEAPTPEALRSAVADRLARARSELRLSAARTRRWRAWLDDDSLWPDRMVVVHGDVHPGHTLVERTPAGPPRLSGLLDWGNAGINDPAVDFVDMLYAGGPPVLDLLLDAYRRAGGEVRPGMRAHVLARASFLWVHVALRGLDAARPAWVETALSRIGA
ncbi:MULTISPECIES: macrolide 2'-phosphotransferase [unclassified Streptomyces]|uniref:macrolide 2'-phosphotransferase n=1 Tax=Streptomyces sp. NPDC023588 TaxID=3154907 RepID=UPI0033CBEFA5